MPEKILHQSTLVDDFHRQILITQTDQGYYRKILTIGHDDSCGPHGRPVTQFQYKHMLRRSRAQVDGH